MNGNGDGEGPAAVFAPMIDAWHALRTASRRMIETPGPARPWDVEGDAFLANQRRRDEVQGRGMRFHAFWTTRADEIQDMVRRRPDLFPAYHEIQKDGTTIDPTDYMQSARVMPTLIEALAGTD